MALTDTLKEFLSTRNASNGGIIPYLVLPEETTNNYLNNSNSTDDYDMYEYNYDDSINNLPLEELIPVGIFYFCTLALGVLGNLLVIISIARYRRMQSVTNVFLTSLASADLLLILMCVPIQYAKWFSFTWMFGEFLCKFVHYIQNVSFICSVLTLTTMSMERYYAIMFPMRARYACTMTRSRIVIIVVWYLSFLLAGPIIVGMVHKEVGYHRKGFWCLKEWEKPLYSKLYEVYMLFLIFINPMCVMSFAYSNICRELWIMSAQRQRMRAGNDSNQRTTKSSNSHTGNERTPVIVKKKSGGDDDKQRKQVIQMLVTVIVLFAICWGPTLIDNVLVAFNAADRYHFGGLKHMRQAFVVMSYFNSCVNPIVYAFMSKNFRESFKMTLMCCAGKCTSRRNFKNAHQSSFQTRTTTVTMTRGGATRTEIDMDVYDSPSKRYTMENGAGGVKEDTV